MNNTFSFQRLFALLRKQWIENNRFYLLGSLALLGLMAISMIIFWVIMDGDNYTESAAYAIYLVGLYITGTVYGSISFSILGSKERGQYWLSFPASHAEKLITTILYNTVLFFVVYTLSFLLVKWTAQTYVINYVRTHQWASFTPMNWDTNFGIAFPYIVWGYFCVQALFILGSVYFKQFAFIKTIISVTVIGGVLVFILAKIAINLFPNYNFFWNNLELREHHIADNYGVYKAYALGSNLSKVLGYLLTYSWLPVFWLVTWYRLKEKEL
ncbi:hypothetical protein [Flavihumibacter sp. CACIAM 22H1]|uniref:hypothetical protein n=1 Tax=Flavihumibacter sp. CACIAM 22H1 TaxID=1812911 RepID=UPI0007A7E96F|nr:hypothetical protein [Flavihumibacter sp. CACIAM 22H1]KYP15011.1 MAG: hypothetical protein A1D16_10220 [Flavihumibacter sp. CACIAM 22H1]